MTDRLPKSWLLALLVAAVWWPWSPHWLSDDFLAVHYAADFSRALGDFTGNQYDLPGLLWFYRPMVTLSFAIETWIFDGDPYGSYATNALAQGLAALLVGRLVHRFAGARVAWCAALLWGSAPLQAPAILWAVGRVDVHANCWILLSLLWLVRWHDGGLRSRAPSLAAFSIALGTKESAIVTPLLVAAFGIYWSPASTRLRGACSTACSTAWSTAWPFLAVLGFYFGWRLLLFGTPLGGYGDYATSVHQALGLIHWLARAVNPLLAIDAGAVAWLGFAPAIAGAIVLARRGRFGLVLGALLLFVACALPAAQFWGRIENPRNLRYFSLAFVPLAVVVAAGRGSTTVPALLLAVLPWASVRLDYQATHAACRRMHEQLIRRATTLDDPTALFVAGLPVQNAKQNVIAFHYGVDRLLAAPFADGRHRLFALRPLDAREGALRLADDVAPFRSAPAQAMWSWAGDEFRELPRPTTSAMNVRVDGPRHLTRAVLLALAAGDSTAAFSMALTRAPHYRITTFTAGGYLTCVLPDEASPSAADGRVSFRAWLAHGRYNTTYSDALLALALRVPIALDLETEFPVSIEAGRVTPDGFAPTHLADRLLWLHFDRDYVRLLQP